MTVTYICENGHENDHHKSVPDGHSQKPACIDCSEDIVKRNVPIFVCEDCEYRWFYKGDSETPTCPQCRGKHTKKVNSE